MNELTRQDLDVLIESMEAWENKDDFGGIIAGMFDEMLSEKSSPEKQLEMKLRREKENRDRQDKKLVRKERSIMLRAKLIALRDSIDADGNSL